MEYHGVLYKLSSQSTDKVYVGSTTQLPCQRMAKHKYSHKMYKEGKYPYTTAFEILRYDDCKIEKVSEHDGITKQQLRMQEQRLINETEHVVNKNTPGRSVKESQAAYRHKKSIERLRMKLFN